MFEYFPLYFFLSLLTFSKESVLPYLLFCGLFLDCIVYRLPFLHTIFIIIFFLLNRFLKRPKKLSCACIQTIMNTSLYLLLLMLIFKKIPWILLFMTNIYNLLLTCLWFRKGRIVLKKSKVSVKS